MSVDPDSGPPVASAPTDAGPASPALDAVTIEETAVRRSALRSLAGLIGQEVFY